jgi:hypothetical protein
VIVVAAMLVPLWVVLVRRARSRRWIDLAVDESNAAWRPAPAVAGTDATPRAAPSIAGLTTARVRAIMYAGAIAAFAWIMAGALLPIEPQSLRASRTQAADAARSALAQAHLGPGWRFLPVPDEGGSMAHRFVWKTAGRRSDVYDSLRGTYLPAPGWKVFVRTFEGDVAERAENWTVHLDRDGVVQNVSHELPESRRGPALDEGAARALARRALADHFKIQATSLRDVSAVPSKLPERTDWTITFADADASRSLPQGEARLSARISGDEIADTRRFVYVAEDWERTERNARTVASIVQVANGVLGGVMVFGGVIAAIVSWSRRRFVVGLFLAVFAVLLVLTTVRLANSFPTLMANLTTSQPLRLQLAILVGTSGVGLGLLSAAMALVAGAVPLWSAAAARLESHQAIVVGVALGAVAAAARGLGALGAALGANEPASWPSYAGAGSFVPFLAASTNPIVGMLTRLIVLMLIVAAVDRITAGWTRRRVLASTLLWLVGGLLGATGSPEHLLPWIASAAVVGALLVAAYILVLRLDVSVVPFAVAVMTTTGTLREGWSQAYPGALPGAIVAVVVMWAMAYGGFRALRARVPQNQG